MPPKSARNAQAKLSAVEQQILNLTKRVEGAKLSKNQRRRRRARTNTNLGAERSMNFPPSSSSSMVMSKASDTGLRKLRMVRRDGLTDQGIAFLKCAFAPPDFQQSTLAGVPDDFRGASLVRKHRYVSSVNITGGLDYYFILAPVPGYAYFIASITAGVAPIASTAWTGVPYTDFQSMFGTGPTMNNQTVQKFRFVSNHIEIIPTVNQMVWTGSIQAWKLPLSSAVRETPTGSGVNDLWGLAGLEGVNTNLSNQYSGPYIMGAYAACYNSNATFEFYPTLANAQYIPSAVGGADFGQFQTTLGIPGLDNSFESMLIKVSGVTANETMILKTWACVEYQITPVSALYEFQSLSPCDPIAINLYREIINNLPVGVPFQDNADFWNRVLRIIYQITGYTSYLPGPAGVVSRGVNMASGAMLPYL